jgi:hypothetical protein
VWQGAITEQIGDRRTLTMTLKLKQREGSAEVTGTIETVFRDSHFFETIVTGTQTGLGLTLETVMYDSLGKAFYYSYEGRVDEAGHEMDGRCKVSGWAGWGMTWHAERAGGTSCSSATRPMAR